MTEWRDGAILEVELAIVIALDGQFGDRELRSLHRLLETCDEFDGLVQPCSLSSGEYLGGVVDAIAVAVGAGGAVTALVGLVAGWLQQRGTTIRVRFTNDRTGRSLELSGARIRDASAADVQAILRDFGSVLAAESPDSGTA